MGISYRLSHSLPLSVFCLAVLATESFGIDYLLDGEWKFQPVQVADFTVGEDECRAWTIRRGSTAPVAAGAIHSDIQKGFIRAEVVAHDALLAEGSLAHCRDKGSLRLEGKEYIVREGDVVHFRFNV